MALTTENGSSKLSTKSNISCILDSRSRIPVNMFCTGILPWCQPSTQLPGNSAKSVIFSPVKLNEKASYVPLSD
jgi:hypothetical protein